MQEIFAFLLASILSFYSLKLYSWYQGVATVSNVLANLEKSSIPAQLLVNLTEKKVEQLLASQLAKQFQNVQTQTPLQQHSTQSGAKERIDIDIQDGKVGIEIKLARSLQRSNERNRLIGQLALYQSRKYNRQNLLLVIIGTAEESQELFLQELKNIVEQNKIKFFFLKATEIREKS